MVVKTIKVESKPIEGDFKITTHFAWLPTKVDNKVIWLQKYQRFHVYKVRHRHRYSLAAKAMFCGTWGQWELLGEKVL